MQGGAGRANLSGEERAAVRGRLTLAARWGAEDGETSLIGACNNLNLDRRGGRRTLAATGGGGDGEGGGPWRRRRAAATGRAADLGGEGERRRWAGRRTLVATGRGGDGEGGGG